MHRKRKNKKDVLFILNNLRDADITECKLVYGENWKAKAVKEIMKTEFIIYVDDNNIPVCMGGAWRYKHFRNGEAVVWLLSTNDVKKYKFTVLRMIAEEFVEFDKKYNFFFNIIYQKNFLAKKWLKRLGFKFDLPKPFGVYIPENFEFFYRIKRNKKGLLD